MEQQYKATCNFDAGGELKFKKDQLVVADKETMERFKKEKLVKAFDPEKEAAQKKQDEADEKAAKEVEEKAQKKKDDEAKSKKGKG